jgi:hypothetical protein
MRRYVEVQSWDAVEITGIHVNNVRPFAMAVAAMSAS